MTQLIRPGFFGGIVAADNRRVEFDYKNESLIQLNTPIDYLFIGDSITHFWELKAYFNSPSQLLINRGIGGDTTEFLEKRWKADCLQLKPKVAIVMIGVNDMKVLEPDGWNGIEGKSVQEVKEKILDHYLKIIEMCKQVNQQLVICSILPTKMTFIQSWRERNQCILEVNEALKILCQTYGLIYVDYHQAMVAEDGCSIKDGLTFEGLHPISTGYSIMSSVLKETLAKHGMSI